MDQKNQKEFLDSLNDKEKEEVKKLGGAEAVLQQHLEKELASLTDDQKKKLEAAGGIEAVKAGLSEIDGTTLFEKAARLDFFNEYAKRFEVQESIEVGSRTTNDGNVDAISSDDIETDLTDSRVSEHENSASSRQVQIELHQNDLEKQLEAVKEQIDEKAKKGEDLSEELEKLDKLSKHPAVSPAKDDDDDKDKKPDGKKPESDDARNKALKPILEAQVSALSSQLEIVKARISGEKDRLSRMKQTLTDKGGNDPVLSKEISDLESAIKSDEGDAGALKGRLDMADSQLKAIDA